MPAAPPGRTLILSNGAAEFTPFGTVNMPGSAPAPTPTVYFESATVSATEGNSGTKTLTMALLRSVSVGTLAVTAQFVQGSAGAADFAGNALPGNKVFTFANGSNRATQTVEISGDTDVESDETFGYQLVAPSGYALGSPSAITGTILNDDTAPLPTVTISSADGAKAEGSTSGGSTAFSYVVTRSTSSGAVNVPWTFDPGTTTADDYFSGAVPTGGVIAFANGETSKSFSILAAHDFAVEPDESFTVTLGTPGGYAPGGRMSATSTITNDDVQTGNVLPAQALSDIALGNSVYGSPFLNLGTTNLPAGDWVMHLAIKMPASNAYDLPILSIAPSSVAAGFLNGNSQLHLNFMPSSSSKSSDPARGALILSGKDDAGNWLSPNSNRSIPAYWTTWGSNVRYLAGQYMGTPDGLAESVFIQKTGGVIQLWMVRDGSAACLHDFAATSFGALTGQATCIGRIPGDTSRQVGCTFQRFFAAAGALTAAQMEAIAQGVDPRQYLPFDQPNDRLTNWQNAGLTAQPDLVGSGSTLISTNGTGAYSVKSSLVPNTVTAEMPRVFLESNSVRACSSPAVNSDVYFDGTCSGIDDDIYLQVVDWSTKTTVVTAWQKVARSLNGKWSGTINGDLAKLQWYDLQIRKGLTGTVYTCNKRWGCGIVMDYIGQSLNEKKRMSSPGTSFNGTAANFCALFSRAKSNAGSTQGTTYRGWVTGKQTGFGEARVASLIAEKLQRPVGSAMSAVEGSAMDAWVPGSSAGYDPMADTWRRIRPNLVVFAQGHGNTGDNPATYRVKLQTTYDAMRADFTWDWQWITEPLCDNGNLANDGGAFDGIRKVQQKWTEDNAGNKVSSAGNVNDLKLVDKVHATSDAAGMGKQAERIAWQTWFLYGAVSSSAVGPKATGVTLSGVNVDVTFAHNGGAALKAAITGDLTGFEVTLATDTGFASKLTITSATVLNATTVRLVLSAAPGAAVRVRYQYGNPGTSTTVDGNGYIPAVSNPLYDDRQPGVNPTLGLPAMFTPADLVSA